MKMVNQQLSTALAYTLGYSLLSIIAMLSLIKQSVAAETVQFSLEPGQCVALHHGQTCYVDVIIRWQTREQGYYCLHSSQQEAPLKCWKMEQQGLYENEIVADKNVLFQLRETVAFNGKVKKSNLDKVLAHAELEMAWVYKKNVRSRSSWRMF